MPVNVAARSHGAVPAAVPPPEPASPRGGAGAADQGGAAAELRSRKAPGDEAVRPVRVVNLPDLPRDVVREIVVRLPPVSSARLTAVDRALNRTMGELSEPAAEPRAIMNKAVQMASESWNGLSTGLSVEFAIDVRAVVDKVWRRGWESTPELPSALKAAFAARDRLLPHEGDGLMRHFAAMLDGAATPEERFGIASHLFKAAQQLDSPARAEMLILIAARIDRMPPEMQPEVFGMICAEALDKLGTADLLATLQALVGKLEFADRPPFDVMQRLADHDWSESLDPPVQAQLLATLAEGIRSVERGHERMDAFSWLLDRALEVPAEHRLPTLEALSRQIDELPMEARAHGRQDLCNEIRSVTAATDPQFADRLALQLFNRHLATGPHARWPLDDGMAGDQDDRLPIPVSAPSHAEVPATVRPQKPSSSRGDADVAAQGAITTGQRAAWDTVRHMTCESLMNSPAALRAAFAAHGQLPPSERGRLAAHLAEMLDRDPGTQAQAVAAGHLFMAAQELDSPERAEVSALIAARIGQMHPDARLDAFSIITRDVLTQIRKADMRAPLQALAGQIEALPAERRFDLMAVLGYQNRTHPDAALRSLSLDPPAQTQLLVTLAEGIRSLGVEEREDAFRWMRAQALQLPAEHRLPVQQALSRHIHLLPESSQLPTLDHLRLEIQNVTAAADPLFADRLALQVASTLPLPPEDRAALLNHLIVESRDLPPEHRLTLLAEIRRMKEDAHGPGSGTAAL